MNTVINSFNSFINRLVHKSTIKHLLQQRIVLAIILLILQMQFFTINLLNTRLRSASAGWELKIPIIDNNLTPLGYWLIPYIAGFFLSPLVPLWAALIMPNTPYRQYFFGMLIAVISGYAIYILLPTYVTKPSPDAVPGNDIFAQILRNSYEVDAEISSHNAAPSQHVFYAVLNMCFILNFRPNKRTFWIWTALAAAISASALLTMRHNSPDIITGYITAVVSYYAGMWLGARVTHALRDADAPIALPRWIPAWLPLTLAKYTQPAPRRTRDLDMGIS